MLDLADVPGGPEHRQALSTVHNRRWAGRAALARSMATTTALAAPAHPRAVLHQGMVR